MINLTFSIIQVVQAHEEGATSVTPDNALGPLLALIIIILAIVIAKRIKRRRREKIMNQHAINLTLVTREGCVHCAQTKEILKKIQPEYPELMVTETDMATTDGQELISKYSIMASPGVIINGELFAMGGTTEKDLRKKFDELIGK